MRRADRLFEIIQHLRGGRRVTAQALAEALEVSKRTVYRDIADLIGRGVPIAGEAGYGYILQDGHDIPPLMFSRDEIAALVAGARLLRAWGGATMARAAQEALIKIEDVIPEATRGQARAVAVHSFGFEMSDDLRARLDRVDQAIEARHSLQITYIDAAGQLSQRQIRPLGLWFWGKVWTLVSWCEMRDAFRVFRLDRITDLQEGAPFKPRPGQTLRDFFRQMEDCEGPLPDPGRFQS